MVLVAWSILISNYEAFILMLKYISKWISNGKYGIQLQTVTSCFQATIPIPRIDILNMSKSFEFINILLTQNYKDLL